MALNVLARTMHEKAQGKQVNFRHTSQKCHGNIGSSPKAIKVNGKIPTECRELWIPGFPREIVKELFLAHFKATKNCRREVCTEQGSQPVSEFCSSFATER